MNYYPHHIGDYRAATSHLSNDEDLAYRRLLEMYYDTEKPIPLDTQRVSRRLRLDTQIIQTVLDDFFLQEKDGWHHNRCDVELNQYHQLQAKNRINGKKGGRPKVLKTASDEEENPMGFQSVPSGNPVVTHSEGNQEPRTKNQEPRTSKSKTIPPASRVNVIFPEPVTDQVRADFIAIRKAKKSPLTQTALDGIVNEASKAGITLQAALEICCTRGWQGFKAEWLKNQQGDSPHSPPRLIDRNRAAAAEWLRNEGIADAQKDIDDAQK